MKLGKVDEINKVSKINKINKIKSSQQKIYYICTFLDIISVVYMLRDQRQNYLFLFFSCVLRKQKKNKACFLALYQDVLIFSLLKDTKNDSIKTTPCKALNMANLFFKKESLCLMHRLLLLLFVLFPPTFFSKYTTKKYIILSSFSQYIYF